MERDLSRGRHNEQSQVAHARLAPYKQSLRDRCAELISISTPVGMTLKELCKAMGKPEHSLSGRLTELKAAGRIRKKSEETRDGCAVYLTTDGNYGSRTNDSIHL